MNQMRIRDNMTVFIDDKARSNAVLYAMHNRKGVNGH